MKLCNVVLLGVIASIINILPIFIGQPVGDLLHQYSMIECYGRHLWTGHLFPSWCMNTNAGYGSPMPLFYFPLPYYFAGIFYPLYYAGIEFTAIYQVVVFALHFITFVGVYIWLKTLVVKPTHAVIGAILFLLLSYRTELIYFRAGYSELFCMAIIPWLFVVTKNWSGSVGDIRRLAIVTVLGLLSHPSVMAMAYLLCFPYAIIYSSFNLKSMAGYLLAGILAALVTMPHWASMHFFTAFLPPEETQRAWLKTVWINNFFDQLSSQNFLGNNKNFIEAYSADLYKAHLASAVLGFGVLAVSCWLNKSWRISKDIAFLAGMTIAALLLTHSITEPLWKLIEMIISVKIPWRMFLFPSFFVAAIVSVALGSNYGRVLACISISFFVTISILIITPTKTHFVEMLGFDQSERDDILKLRSLIIDTQAVLAFARPRWVDQDYDRDDNQSAFFHTFVLNRPKNNANLTSGAEVLITQWDLDALRMSLNTQSQDTLILEHFYFPIWHAQIDGKPVDIKPLEDGTGRMSLSIPEGAHEVVIWQELLNVMPSYYIWLVVVSSFSFCALLITKMPRKIYKLCAL